MLPQITRKWSSEQVDDFIDLLPESVEWGGHSSGTENAVNIVPSSEEVKVDELQEKEKEVRQKLESEGFEIEKITFTSDYVGAMNPQGVLRVYFTKP